MRSLIAFLTLFFATKAFALTAPNCQLAYKANSFGPAQPASLSNINRPTAIAGIPGPGKATTLFVADGVINTVTVAAEDDRTGVTKLTISVDLANGAFNEENTFFINSFGDYRGKPVSMLILRPEGQRRFNFPQPPLVPGQPPAPLQPSQPLTFRGSIDWSPAAIAALAGKVINQIEVTCSSDLR